MDNGWESNGETGNWGPWGRVENVCRHEGCGGPPVGGAEKGGVCCARASKEPADRLPPKGPAAGADDTDEGEKFIPKVNYNIIFLLNFCY